MKRMVFVVAMVAGAAMPAVTAAQGGPGFLFRQPRVSVALRAGYNMARANSDLFDFARQQLTLSKSDFSSPYVVGEAAVRASDHFDVTFSVGGGRHRARSEYRDYVDSNNVPIEQQTTFETVATTVGAKYYFGDRGRSVGRFAWVPTRLTPFVSAGVGAVWYQFRQSGDFIDFQSPTLDVFTDVLSTTGTGATAFAGGGADLSLSKNVVLTGEARYSLGSGPVSRSSFSGFDNIDLNGLQLTVGLGLRF
jgi:hypothetical protein